MTGKDQTLNNKNHSVNSKDQAAMLSRFEGNNLHERPWAFDDFVSVEDPGADSATGLVSLAFIRAAIRRSTRFWCAIAAVGLLLGFGLYVTLPPAYQASTSVLLTYGPYENIQTAPSDNQVIAQSHAVATLAMHMLGLRQSVSNFVGAYTVTPLSSRVLDITVNAPSSRDAVSRANAVAAAFLRFRSSQLEMEQNFARSSLDQQINQSQQSVESINHQIRQLSGGRATSPSQRANLRRLQTDLGQSNAALAALEQSANGSQARTATALAVDGSRVLDAAAPIPHSRVKYLLIYLATGLFVGMALGVGIVVVSAITSDRLRRRADIAQALGAPVGLSVRPLRLDRHLQGRRRHMATSTAEIQQIAAQIRKAVPTRTRNAASLSVVPIGDVQVAALSLVSLAVSCAQQGMQVILADLCASAPAARSLGVQDPGVRAVSVGEARLTVAVPDRDAAMPVGPRRLGIRRSGALYRASAQAQSSSFTEAVTAAYASADLLLTLATLDPSLGGEHLSTWASNAVAVVTAGKSSATKIRAVSEMIRLAGVQLVSGVLVGADKTDESLGMTHTPGDEHRVARSNGSKR